MTYVWVLLDSYDLVLAIFTSPELAFRSLELNKGRGIARVVYRSARLWTIDVRNDGLFLCKRKELRHEVCSDAIFLDL